MSLARMLSTVFVMIAGASFVMASLNKPGKYIWIVFFLLCVIAGHSIGEILERMVRKHSKGLPLNVSDLKIQKVYFRVTIAEPQNTEPGVWAVWIRIDEPHSLRKICEFSDIPPRRFVVMKENNGSRKIVEVGF
jgi:hypothetical protein